MSRDANTINHAFANGRDKRQCGVKLHFIGFEIALDFAHNRAFFAFEFVIGHDDRHRINRRRHMLERHVVVFQDFEYSSTETALLIHQIFLDHNRRKTDTSRNADNRRFADFAVRNDARAFIVGRVGVLDLNRDSGFAGGKNRRFVQHARTRIRQFAQFAISHFSNRLRVFHHARIGHQKAGNIRPVFVNRSANRARHNCARNVAAAARKGFDAAFGVASVKTWNHVKPVAVHLIGQVRV